MRLIAPTVFLLSISASPGASILVAYATTQAGGFSLELGGGGSTALAIEFTLSQACSDVSIAVPIFSPSPGGESAAAYLTNSLGPGTSAANVVASIPSLAVATPTSPLTPVLLFSNLSLGPGTYYLTIVGLNVSTSANLIWARGSGVVLETGSGASTPGLNTYRSVFGFPPGSFVPGLGFSGFQNDVPAGQMLLVSIIGEPGGGGGGAVPEPASAGLMAAAAGVAALVRRRR